MSLLINLFGVLKPPSTYTAVATQYANGADIVKTLDFTSNADGKQGLISFWLKPTHIADTFIVENSNFAHNYFDIAANSNLLQFYGENASASTILDLRSNTGISNSVWTHVLAAWDLGAGFGKIYQNDVDVTDSHTLTNDSVKYTSTTGWIVAGVASPSYQGCIAEFYMGLNQFLDITVTANRRKFISALGKPVSLGTDGSVPTGTSPICYLKLNGSNKLVNSGSGGNFDSAVGTVNDCPTSPS